MAAEQRNLMLKAANLGPTDYHIDWEHIPEKDRTYFERYPAKFVDQYDYVDKPVISAKQEVTDVDLLNIDD